MMNSCHSNLSTQDPFSSGCAEEDKNKIPVIGDKLTKHNHLIMDKFKVKNIIHYSSEIKCTLAAISVAQNATPIGHVGINFHVVSEEKK